MADEIRACPRCMCATLERTPPVFRCKACGILFHVGDANLIASEQQARALAVVAERMATALEDGLWRMAGFSEGEEASAALEQYRELLSRPAVAGTAGGGGEAGRSD